MHPTMIPRVPRRSGNITLSETVSTRFLEPSVVLSVVMEMVVVFVGKGSVVVSGKVVSGGGGSVGKMMESGGQGDFLKELKKKVTSA